jgi:hypothetical protein
MLCKICHHDVPKTYKMRYRVQTQFDFEVGGGPMTQEVCPGCRHHLSDNWITEYAIHDEELEEGPKPK